MAGARLLVTGASGALGGEVARQAAAAGAEVVGTWHTRTTALPGVRWAPLDVRDPHAVRHLFARVRPDVVVHTAYRQDDWAVTAEGAEHVAAGAAGAGARLVHVSSDVVFAGDAGPCTERTAPAPVSAYGRAKHAAELAVARVSPEAVVVRTSLILGSSGGRLSPMEQLVHDLAAGLRTRALFEDDIRCPLHVADLAAALLELAGSGWTGVAHCAGPDAVSRLEIARLVADRDGLDLTAVSRGSRRAAGLPGPFDLRLDSRSTQSRLVTRLRGAREFLGTGQGVGTGTASR